jgi:hypothetical protein
MKAPEALALLEMNSSMRESPASFQEPLMGAFPREPSTTMNKFCQALAFVVGRSKWMATIFPGPSSPVDNPLWKISTEVTRGPGTFTDISPTTPKGDVKLSESIA